MLALSRNLQMPVWTVRGGLTVTLMQARQTPLPYWLLLLLGVVILLTIFRAIALFLPHLMS